MYTNKTNNLELPQWLGSDKPNWDIDLNAAFKKIDDNAGSVSDDIANVAGDIGAVESTVTSLQGEVTSVSDSVDNVTTRVSALESTDATHSASISKLNSDVTSLDAKVTTLEGSVDTLETQVPLNTQNIADLKTTTNNFITNGMKLFKNLIISERTYLKILPTEWDSTNAYAPSFSLQTAENYQNNLKNLLNMNFSLTSLSQGYCSLFYHWFVYENLVGTSTRYLKYTNVLMNRLLYAVFDCLTNVTLSVGQTYTSSAKISLMMSINKSTSTSDFETEYASVCNLNCKVFASGVKFYFTLVSGGQPLSNISPNTTEGLYLIMPDAGYFTV